MHHLRQTSIAIFLVLGAGISTASAQAVRITGRIDNQVRRQLGGHVPPRIREALDQGRVDPGLILNYVTVALAPSAAQSADLDRFLAAQQTPGSPEYQHWLTPQEYAERFSVSAADLDQAAAWLESQGLTIVARAQSRNWIAVKGAAAQIDNAFQTELHYYLADGEIHFANATEPSVPAALAGVITHIRGLHDFRMKPAGLKRASPLYTASGSHYLAPGDFATIYDLKPLFSAGTDGTGQKLVVVGQTQVNLADIQTVRSTYGLPANDPQLLLVPNSKDPGVSKDDLPEADLDLEWSGAVARNAAITYVYTADVTDALQYAIDQNMAPVVSMSYGLCEAETSSSDTAMMQSWAKQGNAQGITWFASSGDAGAADCDDIRNPGLSVDLPAAIPEVTGVGGTEFAEAGGAYWNSVNDSSKASALSYIPETSWNDSTTGDPSASGGGTSVNFVKPSWQVGAGVPSDNARHVPDISMNASANHDAYLVYTGGALEVYGGTSVPTPIYAGIAALLNQYLGVSGVGNINPKLYSLAQSSPGAFHDVTSGDNIVTAGCRLVKCSASPVGYSAGAGYDQVTGLGSVDVYQLFRAWAGLPTTNPVPSVSMTLLTNLTTVAANDAVVLMASLTGGSGVTPAGSVSFTAGAVPLGLVALAGQGGTATASLSVQGTVLPAGTDTITAAYTGGASASASVTVSVSSSPRTISASPTISGVLNGASFKLALAPGGIASVFGSNLASSIQQAGSVPLPLSAANVAATINGVPAPLYYVSSGQLNIQIPYETPANTSAILTINNGGQTATRTISVAGSAPGIFYNASTGGLVPASSGARGNILSLYLTDAGALSKEVATGAAPAAGTAVADLPLTAQPVTVSVGGVSAPVLFYGIPAGLVGVVQVNFQIPSGVATGPQQLIASVGGAQSAPVTLTITP